MEKQLVHYTDLGLVAYKEAWQYQEALMQQNLDAKKHVQKNEGEAEGLPTSTQHHFLLCEHPPVYTLGRNGNVNNILISQQQLEQEEIGFFHINRGGDITFHGPGQIVGYPIIDLEKFYTDISRYITNIEEVIIRTMAAYGIIAGRSKGETGVWINPGNPAGHPNPGKKICAIGIRCSRWVTMHGFALNVNTDLGYFDHIIPCGITNKKVTSMEQELGRKVDMNEVKERIRRNFEEIFSSRLLQKPAGLLTHY